MSILKVTDVDLLLFNAVLILLGLRCCVCQLVLAEPRKASMSPNSASEETMWHSFCPSKGLNETAWDICQYKYYIFFLPVRSWIIEQDTPRGGRCLRGTQSWVPPFCFCWNADVCVFAAWEAKKKKCGGIPPSWLMCQPDPVSAQATDGRGLGLLGNW